MHDLHHLGLTAFPRSVIHDGDARVKRVDDHFRIGGRLTVVKPQENVHSTDAICGAHQLKFLVLCQIA